MRYQLKLNTPPKIVRKKYFITVSLQTEKCIPRRSIAAPINPEIGNFIISALVSNPKTYTIIATKELIEEQTTNNARGLNDFLLYKKKYSPIAKPKNKPGIELCGISGDPKINKTDVTDKNPAIVPTNIATNIVNNLFIVPINSIDRWRPQTQAQKHITVKFPLFLREGRESSAVLFIQLHGDKFFLKLHLYF